MSVFTWVPSYGSRQNTKPAVSAVKFGDGYEQRVGLGINNMPRTWQLEFTNKPLPVADAIEAFLRARGAVQSFTWTPPHGEPGRWVCREWTATPTSPKHRTISCTFVEAFEPA